MRMIDGTEQHYLFFVYIGDWARGIVKGVFSGAGFHVPVWNMSMGYGADMITTMAAYIADPFNWISIFVPKMFSEAAFNVSIVLRFYLAALVFLAYCHHRGYDRHSSIVAALAYAICGVTFIITTESFLENPMILFPLVLWGLDNIFDGKSPLLFIFAVGASFANYFYFGYMICLLLIPFFIARFIELENGRRTRREFLRLMGNSLLFSVLGIALASVMLVPVLKLVLSSGRISADRPLDIFYSVDYYKGLIGGWTSYFYAGPDSYIGFTFLSAVGIVVLLLHKKEYLAQKFLLVILTIFLVFPVFGKMFNGFAYVTNRWSWGYAFLSAEVVAITLPRLGDLDQRKRFRLFVSLGIYSVAVLVLSFVPNPTKPNVGWILSSVLLVFFLLGYETVNRRQGVTGFSFSLTAVSILLLIAYAATMGPCIYSRGTLDRAQVAGKALSDLTENHASEVVRRLPEEKGDWRYDNLGRSIRNATLLQKLKSCDFYISMYNDRVDRFHTQLGLRGARMNVCYTDLDGRPYLEYVLGTRYIVSAASSGRPVSAYYRELEKQKVGSTEYKLFEAESYRPIASLQKKVFDSQRFAQMGMVEREAALTQGVFVENPTKANDVPMEMVESVEFKLSPGDKAVFNEEGGIETHEKNASVDLTYTAPKGHAVYLELYGVGIDPVSLKESIFTVRGKKNTVLNSVGVMTSAHHMSGGKKDWVLYLGDGTGEQADIKLEFQKPGTYSFKEMRLVSLPLVSLSEIAKSDSASSAALSTTFGCNTITCSVNHDSDETLLVTTPFSDGWSVTVDGANAQIDLADTAFMAVAVPAGSHEVIFRYHTPGLVLGGLVSFFALCASIAIHAWLRKVDPAAPVQSQKESEGKAMGQC